MTTPEDILASLFDAETLYQQAPCGYLTFYPDGTIIKANQTLLRLLQYEESELIGVKKFPQLISKGGNIHYEMIFRPLITMNHSVKELAYEILKKDGTVLTVLLSAGTLKDGEGNVRAINAVITDNTDRKKYEAELLLAKKQAEQEKLAFQYLANQVPEMIWTADERGRIDYVNERFSQYFRLKGRQIELSGVLSRVHPDERAAFSNTWMAHIRSGNDLHIELRLAYGPDKYKWHLVKAVAYRTDGHISKWFGSCVDIDEQVRALRQKDEFISIASHELKTPLTSLTSTLQLLDRLKDGPMTPMIPKMIGQANRNVKKMSALIADLLNVSRLREGQLSLNKATFDLAAVISETVAALTQEATLPIHFAGTEPVLVHADSMRIEQVLVNFITNAIKYAAGSRSIEVGIGNAGESVKVMVADQGPGIAADKLPFIFDRYYRVDDSGVQYSGLGLGLYICSEIIRRHGGTIGADSEPARGTTFWFTLPR
ncbi:MAG: PAS domain-containing sensor histidine kinase [Mucilaginibacter sp.]